VAEGDTTEATSAPTTPAAAAPTEPSPAENGGEESTDSPSTEQSSVLAEVDGYIANGGNMRSQPWIAANNVLGQVCPGDQIVILEQQAAWVHFRVVWLANDCHPDRVEQGTGGWASSTLVTASSFTPDENYPVMPQGLQPAIVTDIVDGDAINVTIAGEPDLIRLVGIDTPDNGQCFQPEAAARTAELTLDQFVLLQPDESQGNANRYDQTLRHVWLPDLRLVALELIQEGYGFPFNDGKPYAYEERFEQAEQAARENERGLWSPDTCGGER
jgi:micrococcal nuclease